MKKNNNGHILLISNSEQYGDDDVANTLINDLTKLMDLKSQIHICDYQSQNMKYNYINGRYYYGNEYFYANLSRITLGSLNRHKDGFDITESIDEAFKYIAGSINSFDLYTKVNNGYCYSRYTLSGNDNVAYVNEPIQQIGKFKGDFPFSIEVTGEYNNQIFSKTITLTEEDAIQNDSIAEKIWCGQYIKNLETAEQSNSNIDDIIYNSINSRVLSKYTSFLCLENADYICYDCLDESSLTDVTENEISDTLTVYPNPFNEILNIDILLSSTEKVIDMSITDLSGKIVYKFDITSITAGQNTIIFKPSLIKGNALSPGFYILNYTTDKAKHTTKLIKK